MGRTFDSLLFVTVCLSVTASEQQPWPSDAVARCGNGQFVYVSTGADTCAGYGGVLEWREAADAKRAAADAERKRLEVKAERERVEAARVKAEADRAKAESSRARAESERKRKEAEPLVRVTEAQARTILTDAGSRAKNDLNAFSASFLAAAGKIAPEFAGPKNVSRSDALNIFISGPLGFFFAEARERVRKFEPLAPPPTWSTGIHVIVQPQQIDAPDIEKIVVQRNGALVAPVRTALATSEMTTRMGAKRVIHSGEVVYPLSAFEPGAGVSVTVIAIPMSGSNITRTFGSLELRAIQ
jgi:hypothetical protein